MSVLLAAAFLLSADPAAVQQQPSAPATDASPAPKKVKEKRICRKQQAEVGSHMSPTICLTQHEWDLQGNGVNLGDRSGASTSREEN